MSLRDELKPIIGNKRRFLLFRITDIDTDTSRKLCHVKKSTYEHWLRDGKFVEIYRRRDELASEYKKEAMSLLRRDTQLAAVLLEEEIIKKMALEIETGSYNLIKTNLAKEVYSKLINDLDVEINPQTLTWEQKLQQIFINQGGANDKLIETDNIPQEQLTESFPITESKQVLIEAQKEA